MTYQLYPIGYAEKTTSPPTLRADGRRFAVALDFPDAAPSIGTNAWSLIDRLRLVPHQHAIELYRLALLAYAADTRIPRCLAFNRWERDLVIHVPVANVQPWLTAQGTVTDLLSFLTGDRWRVEFFMSKRSRPLRDKREWKRGSRWAGQTVGLFSGGLDSLIGASDASTAGVPALLVGHCDSPDTSAVQTKVHKALRARYASAGPLLQFWIKPPYLIDRRKEVTTRGRSFLFFSLATLIASGLGEDARLVIPENGFIALNAPLTRTRLGSLSTRTVHPFTVTRYRELLAALRIPLEVETPYMFATKGEMLEKASDREFLKSCTPLSVSCAHSTAGRWKKEVAKHCGRCVPCIIRRAALHRMGWDDPAAYRMDVLAADRTTRNLEDVRAFLVALERVGTEAHEVAVLRSGPIPASAGTVASYASIYTRGLEEVGVFLRGRKTRRL